MAAFLSSRNPDFRRVPVEVKTSGDIDVDGSPDASDSDYDRSSSEGTDPPEGWSEEPESEEPESGEEEDAEGLEETYEAWRVEEHDRMHRA